MNAHALSNPSAPVATRLRTPVSRNAAIAFAVVALHVGFIWALQSGRLMGATELWVPAEILVEFVEPPAPKAETARPAPPPPAPPAPPTPAVPKKAVVRAPAAPRPQPLAIADTTPSPNAPTGVIMPLTQTAPVAKTPVPPVEPVASPALAVVQLPSSDADHLRNPKPHYPALSRRLGEQGLVVYSVLIGVDGAAVNARLVKSSGFERLDQAAYQAIMRWRYTPGKCNGIPEAMTFNVPFHWVLE
ncbi:MAG: TonB family protein [Polaromonas sp.]|nr:TonB family protein [Polaromonas sp.]